MQACFVDVFQRVFTTLMPRGGRYRRLGCCRFRFVLQVFEGGHCHGAALNPSVANHDATLLAYGSFPVGHGAARAVRVVAGLSWKSFSSLAF